MKETHRYLTAINFPPCGSHAIRVTKGCIVSLAWNRCGVAVYKNMSKDIEGGRGKKKRLDWLRRIGLTKLHALQNYLWGELAIHGCMLCPWKTSIWRQGREACAGSASWGVKSEAQRLIWGQLEDNRKLIDKPSELPLNPTYWIYFEQFYSVLLLKSSCSVYVLSLLQTKTVCN